MRSPNFSAWFFALSGNGWRCGLACAHALQKVGSEVSIISIPWIFLVLTACLTAAWWMWPSAQWASANESLCVLVVTLASSVHTFALFTQYRPSIFRIVVTTFPCNVFTRHWFCLNSAEHPIASNFTTEISV